MRNVDSMMDAVMQRTSPLAWRQGHIAVVGADEAGESLNDPDSACNVTGGSNAGVSRMLVVLVILLCAASPHVASHEGVVRAQVCDFCGGDSNVFVGKKLDVLNAEGLDTPLEVELGVMQCVVPIGLGPLTEPETVMQTVGGPVDHSG
jgi:hypothetical protein